MKKYDDYELKLEESMEICKKYEGAGFKYAEGELQKLFRRQLIQFGYLLASMDGILAKAEIEILTSIAKENYTEDDLRGNYSAKPGQVNDFWEKIPESVFYIICEERKKMENSLCIFMKDSRVMYKTMKQFGYDVIECNNLSLPYQLAAIEKFSNVFLKLILSAEDADMMFEESQIKKQVKVNMESEWNSNVTEIDKSKEISAQVMLESYIAAQDNSLKDYINKKEKESQDNMKLILDEMDAMIGLSGVKQEIHNLVNLLLVRKMREDRGLKQPVMSNHLVFTGNPGTGKTTVARKIAKIYKCIGLLENGHLVETDRSGLVAGYMGQTAEKVRSVAEKAMGGILFIDEAYTLSNYKAEGDFGQEAIDALLKIMEDHRDELIVIVAGYPEQMEEFLNSNPGLSSRFNKYISFEDYNEEQLKDIFMLLCEEQDYIIDDDAKKEIITIMSGMRSEGKENFGNAREVRNYFEKVISRQANRIMRDGGDDMDTLMTIKKEDL